MSCDIQETLHAPAIYEHSWTCSQTESGDYDKKALCLDRKKQRGLIEVLSSWIGWRPASKLLKNFSDRFLDFSGDLCLLLSLIHSEPCIRIFKCSYRFTGIHKIHSHMSTRFWNTKRDSSSWSEFSELKGEWSSFEIRRAPTINEQLQTERRESPAIDTSILRGTFPCRSSRSKN